MEADDRLSGHMQWILNASLRLSRMYGVEADDASQVLVIQILEGRSHRLAWAAARREIEARYLPAESIADFELRSDLHVILTSDELFVAQKLEEKCNGKEIAALLEVHPSTVSRMIRRMQRKVAAYYAD